MRTTTIDARCRSLAILLAAALVLAPAATAFESPPGATSVYAWFPKFVCGFQPGNVPLLNDADPPLGPDTYERFKPGNYATTINITNTLLDPQVVNVYAMVTTGDPTIPSASVPVVSQLISGLLGVGAPGAGSNFEVNCQHIADAFAAFGLPPDGTLFEGNLLVVPATGTKSVQVYGVHTMESQNAWERHVLWGDDGTFTTNFAEKGTGANNGTANRDLLNRLELMEFPSGFERIAASGAGGMGLGASIDIECYEAVAIDVSSLNGGGTEALIEKLNAASPKE